MLRRRMGRVGTLGKPWDVGEELERKRMLGAAGRLLCPLPFLAPEPIFCEDVQGSSGPMFFL